MARPPIVVLTLATAAFAASFGCSYMAQYTFENATPEPVEVAYTVTSDRNDCTPRLGRVGAPGCLGPGGFVFDPEPVAHHDEPLPEGGTRITLTVPPGQGALLCTGVNTDFGDEPPITGIRVVGPGAGGEVRREGSSVATAFEGTGNFTWVWRFEG